MSDANGRGGSQVSTRALHVDSGGPNPTLCTDSHNSIKDPDSGSPDSAPGPRARGVGDAGRPGRHQTPPGRLGERTPFVGTRPGGRQARATANPTDRRGLLVIRAGTAGHRPYHAGWRAGFGTVLESKTTRHPTHIDQGGHWAGHAAGRGVGKGGGPGPARCAGEARPRIRQRGVAVSLAVLLTLLLGHHGPPCPPSTRQKYTLVCCDCFLSSASPAAITIASARSLLPRGG